MSDPNRSSLLSGNVWPNGSVKTYEDISKGARTIITYAVVLGLFYLLGRLLRSTAAIRDTIILIIALLFHHRDVISWAAVYPESTPTLLYMVGTLLIQSTLATWRQPTHRHVRKTKPSRPRSLPALVLPCRTTHARLFPTRHSFSYSYLFVGVPIDLATSTESVLDLGSRPGNSGWFSVHVQDYLARGEHQHGFSGKLKDYLFSQGVSTDRYSHAYLVTAPRFLGFSFNPVSFWYLYDQRGCLDAMILEVNNTFDERRMYYMERMDDKDGANSPKFSNAWAKDFHVSPFNDRQGTYSLTASDPAALDRGVKIDNNIVLSDTEGKPKLVARVFSTDAGIDFSTMPRTQQRLFLARWWWVGFMTNPRILREARILWVKKLQVYYRPEVFKTSIGRSETMEERRLEEIFRCFLIRLLDTCREPLSIVYTPAAGPSTGKAITLCSKHGNSGGNDSSNVLEIHVTTPAWYHELICHSSVEHAVSKFCFEAADHEAMLHISDHEMLRGLLQRYRSEASRIFQASTRSSFNEWFVVQLRSRKTIPQLTVNSEKLLGGDNIQNSMSDFDLYLKSSRSRNEYEEYLLVVRNLLLTDRIAFGFGWLLSTYRFILRCACFWYLYRHIPVLLQFDPLGARSCSLILCTAVFHMLS